MHRPASASDTDSLEEGQGMAADRPGFTSGKGGERTGRADARPRLTCSLATVSQEFAMRFSDAVKRHRAHGGDLGQCDALRCSCGNAAHLIIRG